MKLLEVLKVWEDARTKLPPPLTQGLYRSLVDLPRDEDKISDFDACLKQLQAARNTAATVLAKIKSAKPKDFEKAVKAVETVQKYLQTRVDEVTKLRKDLNDAYTAVGSAGRVFLEDQAQGKAPEVQNSYKKLCDLNTRLKTPKFEPDAKAMVVLAYEIVTKQNTEHRSGGMAKAVIDLQNALRKDLDSAKAVLIP